MRGGHRITQFKSEFDGAGQHQNVRPCSAQYGRRRLGHHEYFRADASLKSELDRTLPAVVVEGKQFADNLSIDIVPELDFWLSADAYIRVTSILNFIPDLLQLGAEFKLYVLELITPYQLEQGLREGVEGYEVFKTEHFETQLASGHGYMDVFLRILGIETGAFDDSDLEWEGYRENNVVIDKQEVEVLDL